MDKKRDSVDLISQCRAITLVSTALENVNFARERYMPCGKTREPICNNHSDIYSFKAVRLFSLLVLVRGRVCVR